MVMNIEKMTILFFVIAIGLAAATSVNAGLVTSDSAPNDVSQLPNVEVLCSAPNDLSDLLNAEYFTCELTPTEKITVAELTFKNIRSRTKERDSRRFFNEGIGKNLAVQSLLLSHLSGSLFGKPQNFNLVTNFDKLGFWNASSNYTETTSDTDQVNLELKIDPNYNGSYDMTPAINTETQLQIFHHSP
jgi:hypothetical protein